MINFVNELETRYPSYEQTQEYIHKAHRMRAEAVHDGLVSIRALLQHAFTRTSVKHKPREA